jgi:hypothetical protein
MVPKMAGQTDTETRTLAFELFKAYERTAIKADYEDTTYPDNDTVDAQTADEI